jgi:hypothetical protein
MVVVALVALACGSEVASPVATPPRVLGDGEQWLPVANFRLPNGETLLCTGGGFVGDYRIHGASTDPRLAWLVAPTGERIELAWPNGYSARFTPDLEILDQEGRIVGKAGSRVTGSCRTAEPGVFRADLLPLTAPS